MMFKSWAKDILGPARSPEGRSHYTGQVALYLSETPQGCIIASQRYIMPDDEPRAIYPIRVVSDRLLDLRDAKATDYFGVDTTHRTVEWQKIRTTGAPSPTWAISDKIRILGLHGILYASRSQPNLTHLTLFDWDSKTGATVMADDSACDWP